MEKGAKSVAATPIVPRVEALSRSDLAEQVRSLGPTWLDHTLLRGSAPLAVAGVGGQVRDALERRVQMLEAEGFARRQGQRVVLARDLITSLEQREWTAAVNRIGQELNRPYRKLPKGETARGIYRTSIQLSVGRFAVLDDGMGFSLLPWRPPIRAKLGATGSSTSPREGNSKGAWSSSGHRPITCRLRSLNDLAQNTLTNFHAGRAITGGPPVLARPTPNVVTLELAISSIQRFFEHLNDRR